MTNEMNEITPNAMEQPRNEANKFLKKSFITKYNEFILKANVHIFLILVGHCVINH